MRTWWTIYKFQEPSLAFEWRDPATGLLYDFSDGYTFEFQLVKENSFYISKTSQIAGQAESPNVVVQFAADELDVELLTPGLYQALLIATSTSDSRQIVFRPDDPPIVELLATPAAVS